MKVATSIEVSLNFSEIENLLKEKNIITDDLVLKKVVSVPNQKGLRLVFEKVNDDLRNQVPRMDKEIFLQTNIRELKQYLNPRTINCLLGEKIKTPKDLLDLSTKDLLRIRNMGKNSTSKIVSMFEEYGITLKEE